MKTVLIFILLLISVPTNAQVGTFHDNYKGIYAPFQDPIPIDSSETEYYFTYAMELLNQNSLQKAGQIFDRLRYLLPCSEIADKSSIHLAAIEEKVKLLVQGNLNATWNWGWSGSNWGATSRADKAHCKKHIILNGSTIKFYENDILQRETKYILTQTLEWVNGFITNMITYEDTGEVYSFSLDCFENFTSTSLWVSKKTNYVCGVFGEKYGLVNK